jgi:hypothetical protein
MMPRPNKLSEANPMSNDPILAVECDASAADVSALEREIDQHVYRLYGLTPEEIKIVEEGTR